MGTTAFWAMADIMPEVTESLVSLMVGLAPISVCGQMSGPVRYDNYDVNAFRYFLPYRNTLRILLCCYIRNYFTNGICLYSQLFVSIYLYFL